MKKKVLLPALAATAVTAALFCTALPASADGPSAREAAVTGHVGGRTDPGGEKVPAGFTEHRARVGDVNIDYIAGGHGKTLVLLHGYPQTWYEWRKVLPELSKHYYVIAPDLRGAGRSDAPATGYDKKTLANDVHGLLVGLHRDKDVRIVGHDIGTMVAYSYAAAHRQDVTKLVLSEAPIPDQSIFNWPALTQNGPGLWNFGFFNVTNGLPEQTVRGRETQWVDSFSDMLEHEKNGVSRRDASVYGTYLKDPAHLSASFKWFRTMNQDVADDAVYSRTKLTMPVLAVGAQYSLGDLVPDQVRKYATDVTSAVVPNSGHWIYEEQPAAATKILLDFLGR
ncbi:alpha/beta hydrolase [Streptomyces sp. NPDC093970]|uniref:alpha/beta fold hydrolase n=1 Tax=Streptomyces sp. NPDC093970 TaxID=3155076 RepID=UPI00341D8CCE